MRIGPGDIQGAQSDTGPRNLTAPKSGRSKRRKSYSGRSSHASMKILHIFTVHPASIMRNMAARFSLRISSLPSNV